MIYLFLNDSNVFCIPIEAGTGIFSIPGTFLVFWLEAMHDKVSFFNPIE